MITCDPSLALQKLLQLNSDVLGPIVLGNFNCYRCFLAGLIPSNFCRLLDPIVYLGSTHLLKAQCAQDYTPAHDRRQPIIIHLALMHDHAFRSSGIWSARSDYAVLKACCSAFLRSAAVGRNVRLISSAFLCKLVEHHAWTGLGPERQQRPGAPAQHFCDGRAESASGKSHAWQLLAGELREDDAQAVDICT